MTVAGWMGDPARGAALGRPDSAPAAVSAPKVRMWRIRLDSGGYDDCGAYWGLGAPLYTAQSDCGHIELWFRAEDRDWARAHVLERYPSARFYR
jgi:hypothetical protein